MALDLANEVVIRWTDPGPAHAPLLQEGGITVAWGVADPAFGDACAAVGVRAVPADAIRTATFEELPSVPRGTPVAVEWGAWPGVHRQEADVASATRSLWIDTNGYRAAYLKALYPELATMLAYLPNADAGVSADRVVPFETLELALVEAWVCGGNYVLALEARYREALLRGDQKAMAAWRSLGRTARWLREHASLFRQPTLPIVTVLVDASFMSFEVANLTYRQGVSPAFEPASNPPPPDPASRLVVVAAGLEAPPAAIAPRILAHAVAGATVVVDDLSDNAWWRREGLARVKTQEDREFFTLGKGQVVAYHQVEDPGELALDVVDLVTQARRPTRLWNCPGGVTMATAAPASGAASGRAALHVVNYSRPVDQPVLARIQGNFGSATLWRPDHPPLDVRVAKRGTQSEVAIPEMSSVAVAVFR
jgi:hypothetical protein